MYTNKLSTLAQSRVVTGLRAENSSTNACLIYELVVYVEKTCNTMLLGEIKEIR